MGRNDSKTFGALLGLAAALILACAPLARAQEEAELEEQLEALRRGQQELQTQLRLMREIEELRKGQEEIRKELAEIKNLLRQPQAAPRAAAAPPSPPSPPPSPEVRDKSFDIGANPVMGSSAAPLTLLEFTDYQCPYCGRHARQTAKQIEQEYVETGKLRVVKLDLPLRIHKDAFRAAQATHCAQDQGKFWEMHDRLFANQAAIEPLQGHAEALGLDADAFEACLSSEKYAASVRGDMMLAQSAGASGTPSFVLGRTDPDDPTKVSGVAFIRGAQPFEAFKAQIESALTEISE